MSLSGHCKVCNHPRRREINDLLQKGTSPHVLAATFGGGAAGFSPTSVYRHLKGRHHRPAAAATAQRAAQLAVRVEKQLARMRMASPVAPAVSPPAADFVKWVQNISDEASLSLEAVSAADAVLGNDVEPLLLDRGGAAELVFRMAEHLGIDVFTSDRLVVPGAPENVALEEVEWTKELVYSTFRPLAGDVAALVAVVRHEALRGALDGLNELAECDGIERMEWADEKGDAATPAAQEGPDSK